MCNHTNPSYHAFTLVITKLVIAKLYLIIIVFAKEIIKRFIHSFIQCAQRPTIEITANFILKMKLFPKKSYAR